MAGKFKDGSNVHAGTGSKGSAGDGGGKVAKVEKQHNVEFAEGGDTKMFGQQEAGSRTGPDKSPSTGKPDSSGPGEKFASGGKTKMHGYAPSIPQKDGITSAR